MEECKMSIKEAYYALGNNATVKKASLQSLLKMTAAGGLAGALYGLGSKPNTKSELLHPATATYGTIGLQGGIITPSRGWRGNSGRAE
jgi:hypothetical protein